MFSDPQLEPQTHVKLQHTVVQFYRIIGTVVPLYYRFIRRLWVGQVCSHHLQPFLEENENVLLQREPY